MFGDLIYTDSPRNTASPKSLLGKIKPEFIGQFDSKLGIWTHWSNEFVDIFSVPKEYRASMFGQFALTPEEALDEFLEDAAPDAIRLRKAQLAMMDRWNEIDAKRKKKFIKHLGKKFGGLNSLFLGPSGAFMNLVVMLLLIGEDEEVCDQDDDDMTAMLVLCLLMGLENKGPDLLQDLVRQKAQESRHFQDAVQYIHAAKTAGIPLDALLYEHEQAIDNNQVLTSRVRQVKGQVE